MCFFCSYFSIVNGSFADLSICCLRLVFMDVPNDSFKKAVDYIIVLGSGIRSEEVPPLLKSRLDKGIEYYEKIPPLNL